MPFESTERHVAVGHDRIGYSVCGHGPPVLLCPGAGQDRTTWEPIIHGLAAQRQVITMDHRGTGASTDVGGTAGPQANARDAAAILSEVNTEPAVIVGHSLGGWTALGLAVLRPDLVRRVVVVGSPAGVFPPVVEAFWDTFVERLRDGAPPGVLDAIGRLRDEAWDVGSLNVPVAFFSGVDDAVYPPAVVEAAATAVPGATFTTLPGGHFCYRDEPAAFLAALRIPLAD